MIITAYAPDRATVDNLQAKRNPVVAVGYGGAPTFDPQVNASLLLIGKIIGMEQGTGTGELDGAVQK